VQAGASQNRPVQRQCECDALHLRAKSDAMEVQGRVYRTPARSHRIVVKSAHFCVSDLNRWTQEQKDTIYTCP
jgi:hypothetical protein